MGWWGGVGWKENGMCGANSGMRLKITGLGWE